MEAFSAEQGLRDRPESSDEIADPGAAGGEKREEELGGDGIGEVVGDCLVLEGAKGTVIQREAAELGDGRGMRAKKRNKRWETEGRV